MNSIFETDVRNQLIQRINSLSHGTPSRWGKMNAFQMLRHCTLSEEMFLGITKYNRLFIGKIFGRIALNSILKNDVVKKNLPTHPKLKITGSGDFDAEKSKWVNLIRRYDQMSFDNFVHPFFGKMSSEEIGLFIFKHTDHHLKQFGK